MFIYSLTAEKFRTRQKTKKKTKTPPLLLDGKHTRAFRNKNYHFDAINQRNFFITHTTQTFHIYTKCNHRFFLCYCNDTWIDSENWILIWLFWFGFILLFQIKRTKSTLLVRYVTVAYGTLNKTKYDRLEQIGSPKLHN